MQSRFKSPVFWAAIVAQVISLLSLVGVFRALGLDIGIVEQVVAVVLQLFVAFGVLNDPTNPNGL